MTGAPPILMLVDDEADILVALEDLFEGEYRILAFTSPLEALGRLADEPDVAVILSDQRMPQMSGDVFLAEARLRSDANAVLLTGYADLTAVTAALNGGGIVGYAPKPWEPDALRAMVAGAAEQHQLRRALRQEQALLRGLMEHLPHAVAFKDAGGRIVQLNRRKAEALGRPVEACVGHTEAELGAGQPSEAELRAISERRPVQQVIQQGPPGAPAWTQADYVPLIGRTGQVETLVVMERDITDQRLAEQQLRQADKLRALGTLAGGVAHDFNNLLTAIVGSLELAIKRMAPDGPVRSYLENAALAAGRGAALTQRLLGFSRRTESQSTVVDVGAALGGMRDLLARTLGGGVQLAWRIAGDLWPSSIEADQLEVAILNLAINARDAMPNGGTITIEAHNASVAEGAGPDLAPGDYVVVAISDTGEGMPPEMLERILEPFFTTKPIGKGTGLGLPMVHGFARRSGGALQILSRPGEGTQVSLYLPRAQPGAASLPSGRMQPPRQTGPRARILVVDDEAAVRSVTVASLRDLGHQVTEAGDGPSGLDVLRACEGEIDLALVDFAMPGMNGLDFVMAARALQPKLRVVLLTGYFDVEAAPEDVLVIHKPFAQSTLEAAVVSAISPALADG